MTDVVNKLWGFCHTLRHDGVDYGDYIEQLTYLLFLKMADERGVAVPEETDWPYLRKLSGTELLDAYIEALRSLGKQPSILGDIFGGAQNRFTNPVNLGKLIGLIDETEWISIDTDIKAAAFEGLLEKAASEGKKGAGQYFTPRLLIQSMVRCIKPDPRTSRDFAIGDPACGTGGFLIAAYEWLKGETGGAFDRETALRVRTKTYFGQELVARPRRLALMNMYLHQVEPHITLTDSIYEVPSAQRYDVILTNPPFGTKGANQAPDREDFVVQSSNKQLNFIQHVLTILKPGGRAAIVVPDNVLFVQQAGEVFQVLMEDCDVHTVLRCPRGTFSPYTEGTQTNVIFLTKGRSTESTWIYDARANVPKVTKKSRPLTSSHFAEFEHCYGTDPNGSGRRAEGDSPQERWRCFTIEEVKQHHYKLDAFKWLRDDELDDLDELPEPEDLVARAIEELQLALDDLADMQHRLGAQLSEGSTSVKRLGASHHIDSGRHTVERFRLSILAAACSGQLTADWREAHKTKLPATANRLKRPRHFKTLDQFDLDEIPADWRWVQLDDVVSPGGIFDGPFGSNLKSADYTEAGARVIRLENIGHLQFLDDRRTYVSADKYSSLQKHAVYPGDIVFSSFIGDEVRVCLLPEGLDPETIAKADCFTLRPDSTVDRTYLTMQLAAPRTHQALLADVHGATRPRINTTQLRSVPLPLCSLQEQVEIVRRYEALIAAS